MTLRPGDRIRIERMGDDGLPLVSYGFVGGSTDPDDPVLVMLDGDLAGTWIPLANIQLVSVTNVELCLTGSDLLSEPGLRRGLVGLWHAEADSAGIDVDALHPLGDGEAESAGSWRLAELTAGGEQYVLRAMQIPSELDLIRVRADRPTRQSG